jgi:mannose-6-phosphate isomerase
MMREPVAVNKPWGGFRQFALNEPCTVKILIVKAGQATSLQTHDGRSEFWHILSGDPIVTVDDQETKAKPGDEFYIPKQVEHRLAGGSQECRVLEVSFGFFDENDISRIEDKYDRA